MNSDNHAFRERLLKQEQASPALKERYTKEIQAMLEKRVTGLHRFGWLVAAISGLGFAVLFGTLAILAPVEFPWSGRLIFALGVPFGIGWMVLGIRVFRQGAINSKPDSGGAAGMAWGLPVLVVTVVLASAPDDIVGVRMIVSALAFLIMGALFLLRHVVEQSELKTREKLLQIEYRLAELVEIVELKKSSP